MARTPSTPGPKPALTDKLKKELIEAVRVGLSIADAICAVGVTYDQYRSAKASDPEFTNGVKNASARGKLHHLKRVDSGTVNWQSSAWFLERKYGAEYGQKLKLEHTGSVQVVEEIVEAEGGATHERNGHTNGRIT